MARMIVAVFLLLCVALSINIAHGQIVKKQALQDSPYLKYEGVLTNSSGSRVTGEFLMTFRIYKSPDSPSVMSTDECRIEP